MNNPLSKMTNEELWQLFPILLEEYNPLWPERYRAERDRLLELVGKDSVYRISHIGSTAVRGLLAKPTIDILLEITQTTDVQELIARLSEHGWIYAPQPDKPAPHMMFMKGYTPHGFEGQAFHLHVRYPGDWDELYFRDYLRLTAVVAEDYARLKQELQEDYKHNRDGYTAAKSAFIRRYVRLARAEIGGRHRPE